MAANAQLTTYSAKDCNVTIQHPLIGVLQLAGISSNGLDQITVEMSVDQTIIENAMDGAIAVSVIPGDQGVITLSVFQTSTVHQTLLAWVNGLKAARDQGNVALWAIGTVSIQNIVLGTTHTASGVVPVKIPNIDYQKQAQKIPWRLVCCNLVSQ